MKQYGFTTTILHNDRQKPAEQNSLHKPIHTAVAFGCSDARQLASCSGIRTRCGRRWPDRAWASISWITGVANVAAALKPETRIVFVETIANPRT